MFFFKKKEIDKFRKLLKENGITEALEFGFMALKNSPENSALLNEIVKTLESLGRKKEIGNLCYRIASSAFKKGFIDRAEALGKLGLKYDPNNIKLLKLISEIFESKNLYFEAFNIFYQGWRSCEEPETKKIIKEIMVEQLKKLLSTAEELKSNNIDDLIFFFSDLAKNILHADRCSIFIGDKKNKTLWSKIAHGLDRIIIPDDKGFAGYVYQTGKPIICNDPYKNPLFFKNVDEITGYKTENILTVPIKNRKLEIIGVFQAINKKPYFSEDDMEILSIIAEFAGKHLETQKPPSCNI